MTVYIGIDWGESQHAVLFMNPAGAPLAQLTIPHSVQGLADFAQHCRQLGFAPQDCQIALETAHSLWIDFLWDHDFNQLFGVPPSKVKANRGRLSASGAHDDPRDAWLLADTPAQPAVRTDRSGLQPWHPDGLIVRQLRAQLSRLTFLNREQVRLANRLRSLLLRYYPAALAVFGELTAQITLHFIRRYPSPLALAQVSEAEFCAFAREHHDSHPQDLPRRYARLVAAYPQPSLETISVYQDEAVQLAELLLPLAQALPAAVRQLAETAAPHPDTFLFNSLPGTGDYLAPALLAKFGEDRQRFPTPAAVQALAGTCPVTEQSGKSRVVLFRRACDHEFRQITQQWARESLRQSSWANAYWQQVRPHCRSDSQATRCLANRWLAVAWKLWQTRQPYDEAYPLKQRLARSQPRR